jgi:hypothetical protein
MHTDSNFTDLDYSDLIDLLAEQTAKYTQALVKGDSGNTLDYYRTLISGISKEIERRQQSAGMNSANKKIV